MRKLLLAVSATALFSVAALADGGPVPEPPPPPPPPAEEEPYTPPPPPATEPESVWYAAVHGGVVWLDDMEFNSEGGLVVSDTDMGWAAGLALGYRYGNGFRAEFEGTWRDNDGLLIGEEETADGEFRALNLMLNGLYDFDTGGGFTPYIGAGVGVANIELDLIEEDSQDDGWAFAYQFIGGFSAPLPNTAIEFFADYRYLSTAGLELDFDGDVQDNDEYRAHTVLGGVRFNF